MEFWFKQFKFYFIIFVFFITTVIKTQTSSTDIYNKKYVDQVVENIQNEKKDLIGALDLFDKALVVAQNLNYKEGEFKLYFYSAGIYRKIGHFEKAFENYNIAKKLTKNIGKKEWLAKVIKNESIVSFYKGEIENSIKMLYEAAKLYRQLELKFDEAQIYQNIAFNYFEKEIYDSALVYNNKSFKIYSNLNSDKTYIYNTQLNNVKYYNKKNHFYQSVKAAEKLSKEKKIYSIPDFVVELYSWWARSLAPLRRFSEASDKLKTAENYLSGTTDTAIKINFLLAKSEVFALEGNNHDALDFLQKTLILKDSANIAQNNILLEQFKKRLESERDVATQKSIEFLEQKNKSRFLKITVGLITATIIVALIGFLMKRKAEFEEAAKNREFEIINKKFESFLEQTNGAVRLADPDGKIILWNKASEKLTGIKKDQVLGSNYIDIIKMLIPEKYKKEYLQWGINLLESIKKRKKFESITKVIPIKNQDGKGIYVQNRIFPIYLEGEVLIAGTSVEVTERIKYERGLEETKELAESSDRKKTEFLAQMSHEIRTPINTILNFCSLIEIETENENNTELKDFFRVINRSGKKLIKMMDMFLSLSEIKSGMVDINKGQFDLCEKVIEPLVVDFARQAEEKKLKLEIHKTYDENIISGDEYSVTQAITNLLDNSIKFTEKGKIDIIVDKNRKGNIILIIQDSSIYYQNRSMLSFYDNSKTDDIKVLGLRLARKYCELNNIEFKVEYGNLGSPKYELLFETSNIN